MPTMARSSHGPSVEFDWAGVDVTVVVVAGENCGPGRRSWDVEDETEVDVETVTPDLPEAGVSVALREVS